MEGHAHPVRHEGPRHPAALVALAVGAHRAHCQEAYNLPVLTGVADRLAVRPRADLVVLDRRHRVAVFGAFQLQGKEGYDAAIEGPLAQVAAQQEDPERLRPRICY